MEDVYDILYIKYKIYKIIYNIIHVTCIYIIHLCYKNDYAWTVAQKN